MPARAIGRARKAARRTPLCMPPKRGRATGQAGVDALRLGRGAPMALPGGGAREAAEGGDFPPRAGGAWRAGPGMGTAHHGRHGRTPPPPWAGRQDHPSRAQGRWPLATGCRGIGRYRVVVSMRRWPRRRCMGRRSPPAASRGVAQQGRSVWRPVPGVLPASRLVWESSCCALALARGWGRSCAGQRQGEGRSHCQEARSAARRRVDRNVERSCRPVP